MAKQDDASVIQFVDSLLNNAIERSASDIHVESTPRGARRGRARTSA